MAHRKPLGTAFTSTFDWEGEHPQLLDYLVSQARTWYRVIGVQEKENPRKVGMTLERIAAPARTDGGSTCVVEDDGEIRLVHHFEWYPRTSKVAA